MLARRVFTRAGTFRSQLQRRFIHPSIFQLQALPQPNTWLAKIRFRADGKPRSKPIALGFGSLILFNLSLLYNLDNVINDGEINRGIIASIIYTQHIDTTTYDSVNFDDPISTLCYYRKIENFTRRDSDEEIEDLFKTMGWFFKLRTERGSKIYPEDQAHQIMRSASEKIHDAFRDLNRELYPDSFETTSILVLEAIAEAKMRLIRLMKDCLEEEAKYRQSLSS